MRYVIPKNVMAYFEKKPDGTIVCTKIDFGQVLASCTHIPAKYVGIYETYDYCTKCNEKLP